MKIKCYIVITIKPNNNKQFWCVRGKRLLNKVIKMFLELNVSDGIIQYWEISYKKYLYYNEHMDKIKVL